MILSDSKCFCQFFKLNHTTGCYWPSASMTVEVVLGLENNSLFDQQDYLFQRINYIKEIKFWQLYCMLKVNGFGRQNQFQLFGMTWNQSNFVLSISQLNRFFTPHFKVTLTSISLSLFIFLYVKHFLIQFTSFVLLCVRSLLSVCFCMATILFLFLNIFSNFSFCFSCKLFYIIFCQNTLWTNRTFFNSI